MRVGRGGAVTTKRVAQPRKPPHDSRHLAAWEGVRFVTQQIQGAVSSTIFRWLSKRGSNATRQKSHLAV